MPEINISAPRVRKITEEAVREIAYESNRLWVSRMMDALGIGPRELCRLMGRNPETTRVKLHEILAGRGTRAYPLLEQASAALIERAREMRLELDNLDTPTRKG